jgi:hypothetical protein
MMIILMSQKTIKYGITFLEGGKGEEISGSFY